jgi:uncharacterized protein (DUF2267 family)
MQTQPTERNVNPGEELLDEVRRGTPVPANVSAEEAFSAVICTLAQRVTGGEALHLFSSLPREIHPLLARCTIHRSSEAAARFGYDELVERVANHLGVPREDAEKVTVAVIRAVTKRLPEQEVQHVASQLPQDIRELWSPPRPPAPEPTPTELFDRIEANPEIPPGVRGADALVGVLCPLSRRISLGAARELVEALPEPARPLMSRCLENRNEDPEVFDAETYRRRVGDELGTDDPAPMVRAVLSAVKPFLRPGAIARVRSQLPKDLQDMLDAAP